MTLRLDGAVGSLCRGMMLCFSLIAACSAGDSWSSFHNGGNTSVVARDLPREWSPESGTAWKIELAGYGQSSPVIWKDLVYVTATEGEDKETCLLMAVDLRSGKTVWTRTLPASLRLKYGEMISRAAPTPTVDARGVYVFFESGDMFGFNHDGDLKWKLSLFDELENGFQNNHGYGASPAQTTETIILLVDHKGPSYLMAIDKESGKTRWKTDRTSRSSWSSPQVAQFGDHVQVIVSSAGSVDGYDAGSGKLLWTCDGINGNTIPSATVAGDLVFVGASQARGGSAEGASASNCCLRIKPQGDLPFEVVWRAEKAVCSYMSPLFHAGQVYYVNNVGVLYCLDSETGRQHYAERIDGSCWAQPIASGDLVYFFCKNGTTTVVRAGPTFERVASNRLWTAETAPRRVAPSDSVTSGDSQPRESGGQAMDPVVYGVAAVDDAFVVRVGTHLFRVGGHPAEEQP